MRATATAKTDRLFQPQSVYYGCKQCQALQVQFRWQVTYLRELLELHS